MYKMIAAMSTCALLTTLTVVDAQDNRGENKAKTQGDLMRESAQACEGLKDDALQECLQNYVGPEGVTTGETERNSAADRRAEEPVDGAEQDGASHASKSSRHPSTGKRQPEGDQP
jgi:hypothetical protein